MYFNGTLSIDPSQLTKIEKVKPQKVFKRMLFHLTGGEIADKVEVETFTAISILQQLNHVFRSMGIDNIIRISQDDLDFYLDCDGKTNDLEEAMDAYTLEMDEVVSSFFKTIYLVLEHEDDVHNFSYLLEIRINRSHNVGKNPIEIKVNGLVRDFLNKDEGATKQQMEQVFSTQEKYDEFIRSRKSDFIDFLNKLEMQIKKFIPVDKIEQEHDARIIIPQDKTRQAGKSGVYADDPVFHHYYGYENLFLYTML